MSTYVGAQGSRARITQVVASALLLAAACNKPDQTQGATTPASAATPAAATAPAESSSAIDTTDVNYSAGGTALKGYLAAPRGPGKHPGVLVVHEWWGLNDYARSRARQLAELGYVALAVDMYGAGKTVDNPDDAKHLVHETWADPNVIKARFVAARDVLARDPRTEPADIGAIGYCFGGGIVLAAARIGVDLDAAVSFHGNLDTDAPMSKGVFSGKILIATGGADPFVPATQVEGIKKELAAADVDAEVVVYPGATHAFSNPASTEVGKKFNMPIRYDAAADAASWQKMQELLAKTWTRH